MRLFDRCSEFQGKLFVPELGPSQGKNPFATLPKGSSALASTQLMPTDAHRVAAGRGGRGGGRGGFQQRGGAPGGGMQQQAAQSQAMQGLPGSQLPQYGAPIHLGGSNASFGGVGNAYGGAMANPAMYMAMMQQQAQAMYAQQAAAYSQQQQTQEPPSKRSRED